MKIQVKNNSGGEIECEIADTGSKRARGLMLKRNVYPLFFDMGRESKTSCCMHTLFMLRTIDMVFVDSRGEVVDIKKAKPFKPLIKPNSPARYVIELPEGMSRMFKKGEKLTFRGL